MQRRGKGGFHGSGRHSRRRSRDDYSFLDTIHSSGPSVVHEWLVANSRERLIELTEPPPFAVIVDLAARSMEAAEALYLLGAVAISSKVVLLSNGDADALANAYSIGSKMSLAMAGTLPRPLMMDALLRLLSTHAEAQVTISPEELRAAIRQQQFILHYQPIITRAGSSWQLRFAEALVRWEHPRHGLLYPSQFLNIIKAARLMTALTDFVMSDAAQQAGVWQAQGLDLGVTVNLAPRLVRDTDFADRLLRLLQQFELAPSRFVLEASACRSMTLAPATPRSPSSIGCPSARSRSTARSSTIPGDRPRPRPSCRASSSSPIACRSPCARRAWRRPRHSPSSRRPGATPCRACCSRNRSRPPRLTRSQVAGPPTRQLQP
jgi:sensor c-di-GMP phosphodiesterase-like protein